MASFEITDTTILKILVRRGFDNERINIALTEGELGYTVDTKRLFIGDGLQGGGNVVGNLFYGTTTQIDNFITNTPGLQPGDTVYDTDENILYAMGPKGVDGVVPASTKIDVSLKYLETNFDKTPGTGKRLRINEAALGKFEYNNGLQTFTKRKAFWFDHGDREPLQLTTDVVELNSNYWFLSSNSNYQQGINDGSFYMGNIHFVGLSAYDLGYRLNIDARTPMKGGIRIKGNNADETLIIGGGGMGNEAGAFNLYALSGIGFYTGAINAFDPTKLRFDLDELGYATFYLSGGNKTAPPFQVKGYSVFNEDSYFAKNLTVQGNITAYGEFSVFDTNITVFSGLSVTAATPGAGLFVSKQFLNSPTRNVDEIVNFQTSRNNNTFVFDENGFVQCGVFPCANRAYPNVGTITYTDAASSIHVGGGIFINDPLIGGTKVPGEIFADISGRAHFTCKDFCVDTTGGTVIGKPTPLFLANGGVYNAILTNPNAVDNKAALEVRDNNQSNVTFIVSNNNIPNTTTRLASFRSSASSNLCNTGSEVVAIYSSGKISSQSDIEAQGNIVSHGNIYAYGDVIAYYTTSDKRLKKNIKKLPNALDTVGKLNGYEFVFNDEAPEHLRNKKSYGVIAQEVQEVLPYAVEERKNNNNTLGVDYEKLVPILIEAINELNKKIDKLSKE